MKISVIIPVYNVATYLQACVESVLGQSYQDTEIILVDDGSTDESGKLCDSFSIQDERIRVIHQNNYGLSSARNTGLRNATGSMSPFLIAMMCIYGMMVSNKWLLYCNRRRNQ